MTECIGSGQSIDIPWEQVYQHQHSPLMVECDQCGQQVEAEDSNTDSEAYRLNLPRHDVPFDPVAEEAAAIAAEEDRRFEEWRDDQIMARHER